MSFFSNSLEFENGHSFLNTSVRKRIKNHTGIFICCSVVAITVVAVSLSYSRSIMGEKNILKCAIFPISWILKTLNTTST